LVELLVVVSIIALLISILLPALGKAMALAKLVKCMTNMNAIGKAAMLYAGDYNGCIPRDSGWRSPPEPDWLFFGACYSPYVGGPEVPYEHNNDGPYLVEIFKHLEVYQCPGITDKTYTLTYITNGFNFVKPTQWGVPLSESRLENLTCSASEVVLIGECNPDNPYIESGRIGFLSSPDFGAYDFPGNYTSLSANAHLRWYCCPFDENGDVNTTIDNRLILPGDMRHDGKTTLAFFDGHGESRALTFDELPPQIFYPKPSED